MPAKEIKWTPELRAIVYRRIKQEFGPYRDWGMTDYPQNKKEQYEATLKEIARFISAMTGETFGWKAVRQQIRWGFSRQTSVNDQSHARQFILNKAAALGAGFLNSKDLPSLLLVD